MTFLLKRGATPQQALQAVHEAVLTLTDSAGTHPSSPAGSYVKAVPVVENQLGNAFDRQWVIELVYTPRCFHLMEVAHLTLPLPSDQPGQWETVKSEDPDELPLKIFDPRKRERHERAVRTLFANEAAEHERRHLMERLEQVRTDVQELATFASAGGTILIIDTNTLMHAYPLDQIQWTRNGIAPC